MPLHLLSKKSWNVYNPASIARVRADEAGAAAKEKADEERQEAYEAACRIARLRGDPVPPSPRRSPSPPLKRARGDREEDGRSRNHRDDQRKRRRLHGEDDTDRDIRYARRDQEQHQDERSTSRYNRKEEKVSLTDHAGHIQLFEPPSIDKIRAAKNAEVEFKEKQQSTFEYGALRLSDAAGLRKDIKEQPWYFGTRAYSGTEELDGQIMQSDESVGKDAFGNLDPGRAKRDLARTSAADPLAIMSRAAKRMGEIKKERLDWQRKREMELKDIAAMQASASKSKRRREEHHLEDIDGLDDFRLDDIESSTKHRHKTRQHHDHHEPRREHDYNHKGASRHDKRSYRAD